MAEVIPRQEFPTQYPFLSLPVHVAYTDCVTEESTQSMHRESGFCQFNKFKEIRVLGIKSIGPENKRTAIKAVYFEVTK